MDFQPRALTDPVLGDLRRRMVFISGPRQVGKTTLARALPGGDAALLNWDAAEDRHRILGRELPPGDLWIFDELHKFRDWRNYLKGLWDSRPSGQRVLVTGSGRLDLYRFSGDSLQGRYRLLRMHPFSAAELGLRRREEVMDLLRLGGFPEPWLSGSAKEARRWSLHHRSLLVDEEMASLEGIRDLGKIQLLLMTLPDRVGSPLSVHALSQQLRVSHRTMASWLDAAERLHALFRVPPLGGNLLRAVSKQQKHFHFDWTVVPDDGPRFENFVACHLLKWVHWRQDVEGEDLQLRHFRDRDGREVDFVVTEGPRPRLFVECKWSDAPLSRSLRYLRRRFPTADAWQIHAAGRKDYQTAEGIRVAPALPLLSRLA